MSRLSEYGNEVGSWFTRLQDFFWHHINNGVSPFEFFTVWLMLVIGFLALCRIVWLLAFASGEKKVEPAQPQNPLTSSLNPSKYFPEAQSVESNRPLSFEEIQGARRVTIENQARLEEIRFAERRRLREVETPRWESTMISTTIGLAPIKGVREFPKTVGQEAPADVKNDTTSISRDVPRTFAIIWEYMDIADFPEGVHGFVFIDRVHVDLTTRIAYIQEDTEVWAEKPNSEDVFVGVYHDSVGDNGFVLDLRELPVGHKFVSYDDDVYDYEGSFDSVVVKETT